jgi:hypothetical protein
VSCEFVHELPPEYGRSQNAKLLNKFYNFTFSCVLLNQRTSRYRVFVLTILLSFMLMWWETISLNCGRQRACCWSPHMMYNLIMGSHVGMILTGENRRNQRETRPSATFSTTNPTWIDPGAKPDLHGERPAANNWDMARLIIYYWKLSNSWGTFHMTFDTASAF